MQKTNKKEVYKKEINFQANKLNKYLQTSERRKNDRNNEKSVNSA